MWGPPLRTKSRRVHDRQVLRIEDAIVEYVVDACGGIGSKSRAGIVDAVVLNRIASRTPGNANCRLRCPYVVALN